MHPTTLLSRRRGIAPVGFAAALLAVAGCGGGGETGSAGGPPTDEAATVTVTETEYALELSREDLAAGTYTFVAENDGEIPHALAIRGPGVDAKETKTIAGDETTQLTVTLRNGTYELWCPVPGHRERGMELTLAVGEGGGPQTPTGGDENDGGPYGY